MAQFKDAEIEGTAYFWFAANQTTGAAGDGATPLFDVRLAGAAAGAAPTLSGTPTLLTHANYTDGLHEIAVACTAANGFAAGSEYAVFCTLTISAVNPAGFVGSVKVVPAGDSLHSAAARIMDISNATEVQADVAKIGTVAQSALDLKDFADAGYDPATNKVQGVVLVDTTTTNTDMRGTDNAALASVCTEARLAELGALNIPADIDTLLARLTAVRAGYLDNLSAGAVALALICTEARLAELDAANLPTDIANLPTDADVQTAAAAALVAVDLDHLIETTAGVEKPTVGTYLDKIMNKDASQTFNPGTDSLEALVDVGVNVKAMSTAVITADAIAADAISSSELGATAAAKIADAIFDETATGHTDAGKAGAQIWTDIDAIAVDVAGLDGAAMRGTDSAALATVCTEGRLAELDGANLPTDVANVKTDTAAILLDTGTDGVKVGADGIADAALAADLDIYQAMVSCTVDPSTADHYVVIFYKNGTPVASGVTLPVLTVYQMNAAATVLVNAATLLEASTQEFYYYDETTNLGTAGTAYGALVTATIDGSSRTMKAPIRRDSTT